MANQYKLIHPAHFYQDYLNKNIRPDGRKSDMFRPIAISIGSVSECIGSSMVKLGKTSILCGIRAELAKPISTSPQNGFLIPNVDLSFLPHKTRNSMSTSDLSDVISSFVLDVLTNSGCFDMKDLCIHSEKLVWALYFDIICLDEDGCIFDAAAIACLAALKDLSLPKIVYDSPINHIEISSEVLKLPIRFIPVFSTHIVLEKTLISDPTAEEESLSSATITIGICNGMLRFILKSGGMTISKEQLEFCTNQSKKRELEISKLFAELIH